MKAQTILWFYLCFFRVILSALSSQRRKLCLATCTTAIVHGLTILTEESYMQNQVHIFNFHNNSIHLGLDKMQSQKLACRFRTILSCLQPRA